MCVAPCSWRTRMSFTLESTSASKIGMAAPPDRPKTYWTPSRSRHSMTALPPVRGFFCAPLAGAGAFFGPVVALSSAFAVAITASFLRKLTAGAGDDLETDTQDPHLYHKNETVAWKAAVMAT